MNNYQLLYGRSKQAIDAAFGSSSAAAAFARNRCRHDDQVHRGDVDPLLPRSVCLNDRYNGHHHAEGKACGCIDAEIDEYWQNIHAGTEGQEVWAAHQLALATGSKKDRAAADKLAADWIEHYHKGSVSYSLTETPRGITTTNRYNDHSWLVFDAATGKATVEQLN